MTDHPTFDDLPRPPMPPTRAEQVQNWLDERGLGLGRALATTAVIAAVALAGWWLLRPPAAPVEASIPVETTAAFEAVAASGGLATTAEAPSSTVPSELVVHAAGAVARPGLYRLRPGARVADLLDAAGGLATNADTSRINLAAPVADGERVYVVRVGEAAVPEPVGGDGGPAATVAGAAGGTTLPAGPVDLNTATAEELDALPGVGPSTAQAIIDYRTEHGRFRSVDDLLDVRGIGDAKMAELRRRVTV